MWIFLIGYAVVMVLLGVRLSPRNPTSDDLLVARRSLGSALLFSTLLASNIGAGSTVGATGLAYRDGLSAWWWVGSAGLGSFVLAFAVGPRIRAVAKERGLYTVGDYLEFRFNRSVRGLLTVILCLGSLSILAGQFIALAWMINVTAGVAKPAGCAIAAIVISAYFVAGGCESHKRNWRCWKRPIRLRMRTLRQTRTFVNWSYIRSGD